MIVTSNARDPRAARPEVSTSPLSTVWNGRYHCPEVGGFVSTAKPKEVVDRASENGWMSISGHESFDAESTWAQIRAVHDEAMPMRSVPENARDSTQVGDSGGRRNFPSP